jgi:hypothetical protein
VSERRQIIAGILWFASPIWAALLTIVASRIWPDPSILQFVGTVIFGIAFWWLVLRIVDGTWS